MILIMATRGCPLRGLESPRRGQDAEGAGERIVPAGLVPLGARVVELAAPSGAGHGHWGMGRVWQGYPARISYPVRISSYTTKFLREAKPLRGSGRLGSLGGGDRPSPAGRRGGGALEARAH